VSRLQTVNDRFESARIRGRANGEGPQTTQLSQAPAVWRTTGVGHKYAFLWPRLSDRCGFRKRSADHRVRSLSGHQKVGRDI